MSAEMAKAAIWAALSKLQDAQFKVVDAKSNANDIGIHLNTSSNATTDTLSAQLNAISQLREAINLVASALVGSADDDATVALVWLNQVDLTLQEDALQLNQIKTSIQTLIARNSEVVRHDEEAIQQMTRVAEALRSHISTLG